MTDKQIFDIVSQNPEHYWLDTKMRLEMAGDKLPKQTADNMARANQMAESMLPEGYKDSIINTTPPEYRQMVDADPEVAFKTFYTTYTKGANTPEKTKRLLGGMYSAKEKLLQENINPNDIINSDKGVVMNTLGTVGDVFMTPVNVVAGVPNAIITGKPLVDVTKKGLEIGGIPTWKGKGWEQVIHSAYVQDPHKMDLISKVAKEETLTPDEQAEYDSMKTTKFWGGLIGNIVADPTLLLGKFKLIGTGGRTFEEAKALSKLNTGEHVLENAKNIAQYSKDIINAKNAHPLAEDAYNVMRRADEILKTSPVVAKNEIPMSSLNTLEEISNILKKSNPKEAKNVYNAVYGKEGIIKQIGNIEKAKSSNAVKLYSKATDKIGDVGRAIGDKTGLRKLFVSDVPKKFTQPFAVAKLSKEISGKKGEQLGRGLFKDTKSVSKKYKKDFNQVAEDTVKYIEDPGNYVTKMMAHPVYPEPRKEYWDDINKLANTLTSSYDDVIIKKAISGVDTFPLVIHGAEDKQKWMGLVDEARNLLKNNVTDPRFADIQNELKTIILKNRPNFNLKDSYLTIQDAMTKPGAMAYLPHILTDKAKEYFRGANYKQPEITQLIKTGVSDAIDNVGEDVDVAKLEEAIKKAVKLWEERNSGQRTLRMSIHDINEMSRGGGVVKGYQGDLFTSDIFKIIKASTIRDSYQIRNALIKDGLVQLMKNEPTLFSDQYAKGLVNIAGQIGESTPMYAPKDVAEALDRLFTYTKPTIFSKAMEVWDGVQGFLKSFLTVGRFPISASFQIRNLFGNWMNSLMSGVSMQSLATGYKDAVLLMFKPDIAFDLAGKGRLYTREQLLKLIDEFNIRGSGYGGEILQGSKFIDKATMAPTIKNKLAGALKKPAELTQSYLETGAKFNTAVEDISRVGLFVALLREGKSPKEASEIVKKFLFDYSEITTFEREVAKRGILFYTWLRKNMMLQLEMLFKGNPQVRSIYKGVASLQDVDPETVINESFKPEYMQDAPSFTMPGTKDRIKKTETLVNLQGLLPQYDVGMPIRALNGKLRDEIITQLSPVLQKLIGYTYNYNPKTGKEVIQSVFDQNASGTLGSVLNDIIQMTPARYLQMYQNLEPLSPNSKLDITGKAPRKPATTVPEALYSATIGKPTRYDEKYGRMIASNNLNQQMTKEINILFGDLNKVKNQYSGKQVPIQDIKAWMHRYNQIYNSLKDANKQNIPIDKQTIGRLKNVGKALTDYINKFYTKPQGGK